MAITLYVVVPCYNEEEVLAETTKRLNELVSGLEGRGVISESSRIVYVDDGSADRTWSIIEQYSASDSRIRGIKLAHNAGHQNALMAGMMSTRDCYDCVVTIDADLQDDVNAITEMVEKFSEGCDIVYGVRSKRATDTAFKRVTAQSFYKIMKLMGVDVVFDHADYRLMSRRAVEALSQYPERNLFLRGMVPTLGFKTDKVYYERSERFAGESKYPLKKMLSFAFDGITSFTVTPIKLVTGIGAIACVIAVIMGIFAIVRQITGHTVSGWASLMCSIWFLGGLQLLGLGLIGEYIGKIFKEVKRRPLYIIEEDTQNQKGEAN